MSGRPSCLVVDDSRIVRRVARRILEGRGLAVREAENGAAALLACHDTLPDCILLDWMMPVMDGLDFLRALRSHWGPDRPAVAFCTTQNDPRARATALANGAQGFIAKPFDAAALCDAFVGIGVLPGAAPQAIAPRAVTGQRHSTLPSRTPTYQS